MFVSNIRGVLRGIGGHVWMQCKSQVHSRLVTTSFLLLTEVCIAVLHQGIGPLLCGEGLLILYGDRLYSRNMKAHKCSYPRSYRRLSRARRIYTLDERPPTVYFISLVEKNVSQNND